eukprot:scaffold40448_cov59-Phaeocystis_antarctica.AAC.3
MTIHEAGYGRAPSHKRVSPPRNQRTPREKPSDFDLAKCTGSLRHAAARRPSELNKAGEPL